MTTLHLFSVYQLFEKQSIIFSWAMYRSFLSVTKQFGRSTNFCWNSILWNRFKTRFFIQKLYLDFQMLQCILEINHYFLGGEVIFLLWWSLKLRRICGWSILRFKTIDICDVLRLKTVFKTMFRLRTTFEIQPRYFMYLV